MTEPRPSPPSTAASRSLDASNFFLADMRDGLGLYLAVYLVAHWDEAMDDTVTRMAAAIITPRLARMASTSAPAGVCTMIAVIAATDMTRPMPPEARP